MAIEYAEDSSEAPEMDESETIEIPASILGDAVVGPGDIVRLEVVESPEDSEMIIVRYAQPKKREKPEKGMGGIDEAVAQFEA